MDNTDEQNLDRVGTTDNNIADSTSATNNANNNEQIATATDTQFDIFAWANHLSRIKNDLDVDLFLVNKHYTVYHLAITNDLKPQIGPVFVLEVLNEIEKGAGLGLEIREFEKSEAEPGVLLYSS